MVAGWGSLRGLESARGDAPLSGTSTWGNVKSGAGYPWKRGQSSSWHLNRDQADNWVPGLGDKNGQEGRGKWPSRSRTLVPEIPDSDSPRRVLEPELGMGQDLGPFL